MRTITIDGYFTERDCVALKEELEGKDTFNCLFHIDWSNYAGNCSLSVTTDYPYESDEEMRDGFIWLALLVLSELHREEN